MESRVLGETIAADTQCVEVECHELYGAPCFGSFVRIDGEVEQFAVVSHAGTAPLESSRLVQAHRLPPGELEARKPHLNILLRTTFQARIVGYGAESGPVVGTAPQPGRLHAFVAAATPDEVRALTRHPGFLRPLTLATEVALEDLLLGALQAARVAWGAQAPLVAWGKYLARLLGRDYLTLEGVLQRLGEPDGARAAAVSVAAPRLAAPRPERWEERLPLTGRPGGGDPFAD